MGTDPQTVFGEKTLSEWMAELRGSDGQARLVASEALAAAGADAVHILAQALGDEDEKTVCLAARSLTRMGANAAGAFESLVGLLDHDSFRVREHAVQALAAIGDAVPTVITVLHRAQEDEHWHVRQLAAQSLRACFPDPVPHLLLALRQQDAETRIYAAKGLGQANAPEHAVASLTEALQDDRLPVRKAVLEALGAIGRPAIGSEKAIRALLRQHKDSREYPTAAIALHRMGADLESTVPILVRAMADRAEEARTSAADGLRLIGLDALGVLLKGLKSSKPQVRSLVAQAIGAFGSQATLAVPELIAALDDSDRRVSVATAGALGQIGPKASDAVPRLRALAALRYQGRRQPLGRLLGLIRDQALARQLTGRLLGLADENAELRAAAKQALQEILG